MKINLSQWCEQYRSTKKLPAQKIPCTACDCDVTMYGDNLHKRVEKFVTIENLLTTFKCRSCVNVDKPVAKSIQPKPQKEVVKKVEEVKSYVYIPKPPTVVNLLDDPVEAAKLTATECMRPDIFLDSGRRCDDCTIASVCACTIKSFGKSYTNQSAFAVKRK